MPEKVFRQMIPTDYLDNPKNVTIATGETIDTPLDLIVVISISTVSFISIIAVIILSAKRKSLS